MLYRRVASGVEDLFCGELRRSCHELRLKLVYEHAN